jgi:hypothetical protein
MNRIRLWPHSASYLWQGRLRLFGLVSCHDNSIACLRLKLLLVDALMRVTSVVSRWNAEVLKMPRLMGPFLSRKDIPDSSR